MSDDLEPEMSEEQFLELASNNLRKVRTPEGAKKFGQPIGTIITADMIAYAKKHHSGMKVPEDETGSKGSKASSSSSSASKGTSSGTTVPQPAKNTPGAPEAVAPTITGPKKFSILNSSYSAPDGSRIFRSKKVDDVAYVLTPDGEVHVFNEHGEIPVPENLQGVLATKLSKLKGEDALYKEDSFDSLASGASLADQAPGALLKKNGETVFSKQEDGTWLNEEIGVSLSDDDLQSAVYSGAFELQSASVDEVDLNSLSKDELQSTLESFPDGKVLSFGAANLTKTGDKWNSSITGKDLSTDQLVLMAYGTSLLADKPAPKPKAEKPDAKKRSKKDEQVDPLLDPENEINPVNEQKKIAQDNLATGADVINAKVGDKLYHDQYGLITKDADSNWTADTGSIWGVSAVHQSAQQGHVSHKPWKAEENGEEGTGDNAGGEAGVSGVSGSGGGNSGSGGSVGSGDSADEGDEPLTYAGVTLSQEAFDEALEALDASKVIQAIKAIRKHHPMELMTAKNVMEAMREKHSLKINGLFAWTKKRFGKNDRTDSIRAAGGATPDVFELTSSDESAKNFREAMEKSLANNPYAASVYVYPDEEYAKMRLFLAEDGKSGIAIHNGNEIVSVFSDPTSEHKKVGRHLISIAVENGGTRLDAFDTVLPKIYAAEGFETKARLKWNDDYAPDGWDKKTFEKFNSGEPDVVFMEFNKDKLDGTYNSTDGAYVNTYDEGLAATGGTVDEPGVSEGTSPLDASVKTDISEWTNDLTDAWREEVENSPNQGASGQAWAVQKMQGLDGKPEVLSDADFDAYDGEEVYRGVSSEDLKQGFFSGDNWVGTGGNGSGLYFSKDKGHALKHANFSESRLISAKLRKGAVILPAAELEKKRAADFEKHYSEGNMLAAQLASGDLNLYASAIGIDGYSIDLEGYPSVVLTNRNAVVTRESDSSLSAPDVNTPVDWEAAVSETDFSKEEITDPQHDNWLEFLKNHGDDPLLTPEEPTDLESAVAEYDFSEEEITQSAPTTPLEMLSNKDIQQAIAALESHSGFQIKYGLKSLDDGHPLKSNPELLDSLVADAKSKNPNLSPKQALIQDLKVANGTAGEPLADWEQELLGVDTTKILIGAETSKNTATGLTGGSYTKKDIQDAIDLLENFEGKAFKSYLNKNGNKLGELSPNDIVGFNKDKTVTKKKFVDLLKKKIADNPTPEPTTAPKIEKVAEKSPTEKGYFLKSTSEFLDYSAGTRFGVGSDPENPDYVWELKPDGNLLLVENNIDAYDEGVGTDVMHSSEFSSGVQHQRISLYELPSDNISEDNPPSLEDIDPATLSQNQVLDLPIGQEAYFTKNGETYTYTKVSGNSWESYSKDGNPVTFYGSDMFKSFSKDAGWSFKKPESSNVPEVDAPEEPQVDSSPVEANSPKFENGHILIDSGFANKIGGQAGSNEGGLYELTTANGVEKYYVKKAQSESHGQNEALANALYAKLGVNAPQVDFASDGNLYSKIVDGDQDMQARLDSKDKDWLDQVQQDFAIDAWLSNRDVFGMTYDNILTDKDGTPWKIDNGGAIEYRAMGEKKTDFGDVVTELDVFRTGKKSAVFGPGILSKENELDGAKRLAKLSPDEIRQMVKDHNLSDELADKLVARRQYVLNYYNLDDPYAAQAASIDASSFSEGQVLNTPQEVDAIPEGGEVWLDGPGVKNPSVYRRISKTEWQNMSVPTMSPTSHEGVQGLTQYGFIQFKSLTPDDENTPVASPYGIAPGKYNSGKGAKAALWVKPDGTGVYTGMKGKVLELDAEAVKKNFDAGMSNLVDTPDLSTYPSTEGGTESSVASKTIPTLGSVDSLPDGVYSGPADTTFTVTGDTVVLSKPAKTVPGLEAKVGQVVPNKDFINFAAPVGTVIGFKWSPKDDPDLFTKQEDGSWTNSSNYYFQYAGGDYEYYAKKFKIISYPGTDDNTVKKSSAGIKTKYLQGQLLDPATKSSVYPPGHTGAVTFYGAATDVASLRAYRNHMADPDILPKEKAAAHTQFGVPLDVPLVNATIFKDKATAQERIDVMVETIDKFLASAGTADVTKPGDFLAKDSNGFFKKPEALVNLSHGYYTTTGELSNQIGQISESIGEGKLVGLNMKGGTKSQKSDWLDYIKGGNFKAAYEVESQVAASNGKAHPTGSLHPGHPNNTETHKVKWGPAIDGELAAGTDIPGDWTSPNVDASAEEINNYMILAKAQYPEYLSLSEKRMWVKSFRSGNQNIVDYLSVSAKGRKDAGQAPLSEPPVWTDNLVPAKPYDIMFDSTQFPQNWDEYDNYPKAISFYDEISPNEPELVSLYENEKSAAPYNYEKYWKARALDAFFAQKEAAYLEELNKPVYAVSRIINSGSHPTFIVSDQFDRKKIFKPLTAGKEWRAELEATAHEMAAKLGFSVPTAVIGSVSEGLPIPYNNKGILMDFAPNVGSFGNVDGSPVDISSLTPKQFGQLASEHVLDWFLDNDDAHSENILIGTSGEIVAIDKGRAFLQYGHWHGLDVDNHSALNINTKDSGTGANVVYYDMIEAIKSGKMSQEQMDAAYNSAMKSAKRLEKTSDGSIESYVRAATASRTNWDVPDYAKDWPTLHDAPSSQDELVSAVLARKNSLTADIDEMWEKLYSSAGLTKPEKPAKALGEEIASGWDEEDLVTNIMKSKVWGASPLHASAAFSDGASLLWTEKNTKGIDVVSGKLTLGSITQEKVLGFLKPKVDSTSSASSSQLVGFPSQQVKAWKKFVTDAGKDASNNATSGAYNSEIWSNLSDIESVVDKDIAYANTPDIYSMENAVFPSGAEMPGETVPQYLLALQHHKEMAEKVLLAKKNQVATDKADFKDFVPPKWKSKGLSYSNPTGEVYRELLDGTYLNVSNGSVKATDTLPPEVLNGENGWTLDAADVAPVDPEKYSYSHAGQYAGTLGDSGEKTVTDKYAIDGHPGYEYRIDLPTGEVVFFRNGNSTSTARTQQGTVRFHLNPELGEQSSLANVQAYLEKWGLDTSGADEDGAESVYWRQMFRRIIDSNTSGAPLPVATAKQKLLGMRKDLEKTLGTSMTDSDIPEAIGLTQADERDFWNSLAAEAFGADKVNAFIAEGRHLPQFQHMDLGSPDTPTGLPYFNRIDVENSELQEKGTLIAVGNTSDDSRFFDYIKSGGMISTEERLRILGVFKTGQSSSGDQNRGGATSVFTRIASGQASKEGALVGNHKVYFNPSVFMQTGTYSYASDSYGDTDYLSQKNAYNPLESLSTNHSKDNETMIKNNVSLYDYMELMVFEDDKMRLKAIEEFKQKGLDMLRGLPIEDRLVMRTNLTAALSKVKAAMKL